MIPFSEVFPAPKPPRVVYRKNPLVNVVAQLQFPPVLRIIAEAPADFQDQIRSDYPFLIERNDQRIPPDMPPAVAQMFRAAAPAASQGSRAYDFVSEDRRWTVSLAREFVALSTEDYARWEEFRGRLVGVLNALQKVYAPPFYSRVGLRYVDVIRRSRLGLGELGWSDLLREHISGPFNAKGSFAGIIDESHSRFAIKFPDGVGRAVVRHGLAEEKGNPEEFYLIDTDFYTERKVPPNHATELLDYFNSQAGRLFRWCITDRLHGAMDPEVVPSSVQEA